MITLKDFKEGATYPPLQENQRLTRISQNRKLYNNDLRPYITTESSNSVRVNLFRKAIEIYVNFLLSEGIKIDFGGAYDIDDRINHIVEVLYLVNTDSKRYGTGVVSIDYTTGLFKVYEPDQWYQIRDNKGNLTSEVLVEYSNNPLEVLKNTSSNSQNYSAITIIINDYQTNTQVKDVRELKGGKIGKRLTDALITKIIGRQVSPLFNGYAKGQEGTSVFDDIKDTIIDMVRIKQNLSMSLQRNSRPHLVAPAAILQEDKNGKIDINTEGMLFPLNVGDEKPFYLQWDTNANAAKFQMDEHWKAYFSMTSIPRMLFEPSKGTAASGKALKRMLFPFVSALAKLKTNNKSLIRQMLVMYDNYLLSQGLPRLPSVDPTIEIEYEDIFKDENNNAK